MIALNLWSFAGDTNRESVNYFMAKPFVYYTISERWHAIYVPYGITIYWDKPAGDRTYFPVGGGAQYKVNDKFNVSAQVFKNVLRPSKGTKYDLRFMFEVVLH